MKRKPTDIKKTIKKRIEYNQRKHAFIQEKGGVSIPVKLVGDSKANKRNAMRQGIHQNVSPLPILDKKYPVSIIVTAYMVSDYIEECLDSIEIQTYFVNNNNFEVLVGVDNCQKTLNKLLEIKHKYRNFEIFMMNSNKGTYITSNTLLCNVKNNHIIRFDSDDVMKPELVNEVMHFVDEFNVIRFKYDKLIDGKKMAYKSQHAHGAIYCHKSVYDKLGGYQGWMCAADTEFLRRGKKIINEKLINQPLFFRRFHNNSLTRNKAFGMGSEKRKIYHGLLNNELNTKIERKINSYVKY